MGERMEIRTPETLAGVICHCRRLGGPGQHPWMGRVVLPHGSEFLITRLIQHQERISGGGEGKGSKKKYTFGVFSFFASLHCVTKYISALSHILVQ
jgi:hypothetical protein